MKEWPILFSAPMIIALLAATKTQTRRIIKHSGNYACLTGDCPHMYKGLCAADLAKQSPYGQPGDHLIVREAWRAHQLYDPDPPREIPKGNKVWYEADDGYKGAGRFRPGMFMPRWASRIMLEITGIRVERLNDISEADATAEGITCEDVIVGANCNGGKHQEEHRDGYFYDGCDDGFENAIDAYEALWTKINGAGSWDLNPYIWVLEFRRIKP